MTDLKSNIDHYMKRKGIKMYSYLLVDIAKELGIKGQAAYAFADKEKANFSKMLKGERPLKYEFIIPLEKIFGVSLAKLVEPYAYKDPVEPSEVPYIKGFRYYAYKDDPNLYDDEFIDLLGYDGNSSLTKQDEYGKTFIDYIVEYGSVNGVRFLHDKYKIKLKWYYNQFNMEPKGIIWTNANNMMEFARLVASMNDAELFNDIYDTYNMFASNGFYLPEFIYSQPDFFEIVLDNEHIYKTIFEIKKYENDYAIFRSINPIINGCLNFALDHLDKYREQAIEILKFGIKHNQRIKDNLDMEIVRYGLYVSNEIGGIYDNNRNIVDVAIIVNNKAINDSEIKDLVDKLPVFKNNY